MSARACTLSGACSPPPVALHHAQQQVKGAASALCCRCVRHNGQTLLFQMRLYVADMAEQYNLQGLSGTSSKYSSPTHMVPKDQLAAPNRAFRRRTQADMMQVGPLQGTH